MIHVGIKDFCYHKLYGFYWTSVWLWNWEVGVNRQRARANMVNLS